MIIFQTLFSGERVDIHIMRDPPGGDWQQVSTEVTDKTGRVAFTLPPDKALSCGMYPVKMVVRLVTYNFTRVGSAASQDIYYV